MEIRPFLHYIIFGLIGIIIGFELVPAIILGSIIIAFSIFILWQFSYKDVFYPIVNLPFLLLLEPYTRTYLTSMPYLFLQYLIILSVVVFQINKFKKNRKVYTWFTFFMVVICFEIFNTTRTIDSNYTRSVVINSLALLSYIILGLQVNLNNGELKKLFKNISLAGFMLTGIVAAAHFKGEINYGSASNFESSNGMGPVQLSFYLSFCLVVTYLYFLKFNNSSNKILFYSIIAVQCVTMVLTFSRGGLYFFAVVIALVNIESIINFRISLSYIFGLFLLLSISFYVYNFTRTVTGGAIIERYQQEGTSNRDVLVDVGIEIFKDNPIIGIGTGNFNMIAADSKYFGKKSGAHNEFIRILAEHGFLAITCYVLFFSSLFFRILKYRVKIPYVIIPILMILAFNFGSIHNGLKLSLQSFSLFMAVSYINNFMINKKHE
jgi:O-antigen ligase